MNKQELKRLLAIARPAIIAAYGRGKDHHITAYNVMSDDCIWIEVERMDYDAWDEWTSYKLRIEGGKVTYLNEGELM